MSSEYIMDVFFKNDGITKVYWKLNNIVLLTYLKESTKSVEENELIFRIE